MRRRRLLVLTPLVALMPWTLPAGADPVCLEQLPASSLPAGTPLACPPPKPEPKPKPKPKPEPAPQPAPPTGRSDLTAFRGLGTWLDVYDYSREYTDNRPRVKPSAVDVMAREGVRTIYLQVAKGGTDKPDLLSKDLLGQFLVRAHAKKMRVVAWYLPLFNNLDDDFRHLSAALRFRSQGQAFDALGVDIEWRNGVKNHDERSRRLVTLSKRVRSAAPKLPLDAIVMPPVVTDVINKGFWPRFPWASLKPLYDVWQPMSYWTNRSSSSKWRDAYTYTKANVEYLRRDLKSPKAPVHPIGGIGNKCTPTDYQRFAKASVDTKSIGGSSYDYATTKSAHWRYLRGVPR